MSNMYDFIGKTVNPIGGACIHNCPYCYVKDLKKRFPAIRKKYSGFPKFYPNELKKINGSGKQYFLCSMADIFADNIPVEFIEKILDRCRQYPDNEYLIQSKNIRRINRYGFIDLKLFPKGVIFCTTIESNRIVGPLSFELKDRAAALRKLAGRFKTMITIEPIMDFDLEKFVAIIRSAYVSQVNIGADSKNSGLDEPEKYKILALIEALEKYTTVKRKDNLWRLLA